MKIFRWSCAGAHVFVVLFFVFFMAGRAIAAEPMRFNISLTDSRMSTDPGKTGMHRVRITLTDDSTLSVESLIKSDSEDTSTADTSKLTPADFQDLLGFIKSLPLDSLKNNYTGETVNGLNSYQSFYFDIGGFKKGILISGIGAQVPPSLERLVRFFEVLRQKAASRTSH